MKQELIYKLHLKTKYFSCLVVLLCLLKPAAAQQYPLYSQFEFNKYLFNPSVAGADQVTTVHLNVYEQWLGFKGAPKFLTASIDSRIFSQDRKPRRNILKKFKFLRPENLGFGAQLFNEKYGTLSQTGLTGTYAYHLKMDDKQLSFGFSSVFSNLGLSSSEIVMPDEDFDYAVEGDNTRRWIIDFDFGTYLTGKDYFAGYSIHHLSESALQWGGSADADYRLGRMHYFMAGYNYDISSNVSLEPTALYKLSEQYKDQFDLNLKCTLQSKYWCGLSYKTSNVMSIFTGLRYDRYIFCYAFDYNLTAVRRYSYGSHEIHVAVKLGNESSRYKWLNTY